MAPGKILVIRGGAIGDFILTLPVLTALRRHLPEAAIEVLGYSHIAQLALAGGMADAVHSIEAGPLAGFFARNGQLDGRLQRFFAEFAIIISFLYDPDEIFKTNVARCSQAQFIAGPHRPRDDGGIHATTVLLESLERLAIFDADPVPRLSLSTAAKDCEGTPSPGRLLLAVHPGSGSERKNWPEERWAGALERLAEDARVDFLIVGGEAEGERLERLARRVPAGRGNIARSLPLPDLAQRLVRSRAFAGHDSGISHLAGAIGVPSLVLWGDTAEAVWRPQGAHVRILRPPEGLHGLSVQTMVEELQRLLESVEPRPR